MSTQERLYSTEEGAYATRMTVDNFRVKAMRLKIRGKRQGVKVYYTKKQLEDIINGVRFKP